MLHKVEWTEEKISEFWNNTNVLVDRNEKNGGYFADITGPYLLKKVNSSIHFKGKEIADYGAGQGFLIAELCNKYHPKRVCGIDLSEQAVSDMKEKCGGYDCYGGSVVVDKIKDLGLNTFDIVFLTEVVEHMSDDELDNALNNIKMLLRPGGLIVITTPNDEDLKNAISICPDCGCYFHWVQHVRSWNREKLSEYMSKRNFNEYKIIVTTLFAPEFIKPIFAKAYDIAARVMHRKQKNLIYIGTNIIPG